MDLANRNLLEVSQDPVVRRAAQRRRDEHRLYLEDLATSRNEGETKGQAKLLLKLLGLRFGELPDSAQTRVTTATSEHLELWAERVLTAKTLNEVFAE